MEGPYIEPNIHRWTEKVRGLDNVYVRRLSRSPKYEDIHLNTHMRAPSCSRSESTRISGSTTPSDLIWGRTTVLQKRRTSHSYRRCPGLLAGRLPSMKFCILVRVFVLTFAGSQVTHFRAIDVRLNRTADNIVLFEN